MFRTLKQMQNLQIVLVGLVVTTVLGCASKSSKTVGENNGGQNQPTITQQTGVLPGATPGTSNQPNCFGAPRARLNSGSGAGYPVVNGQSLFIAVNEQRTSLCEVLRMTGKKVAIFQFAGIDCLSCQDEAKSTQAALTTSGEVANIIHVLAFTHNPGDFTTTDMRNFAAAHAPTAFLGNDYNQVMWNMVNPRKRPATLIMNSNMQIIPVTGEDGVRRVVQTAMTLVPVN